jgi:hypothetical protein
MNTYLYMMLVIFIYGRTEGLAKSLRILKLVKCHEAPHIFSQQSTLLG